MKAIQVRDFSRVELTVDSRAARLVPVEDNAAEIEVAVMNPLRAAAESSTEGAEVEVDRHRVRVCRDVAGAGGVSRHGGVDYSTQRADRARRWLFGWSAA